MKKGNFNMKEKNLCNKKRKIDNPYEIWTFGDWEWRVLKKYQNPSKEKERWFCGVKSPYTYSDYELETVYAIDIKSIARRIA